MTLPEVWLHMPKKDAPSHVYPYPSLEKIPVNYHYLPPILMAPSDFTFTLRDYMAGKALQSLMDTNAWRSREELAEEAYNHADAMLAARGL